MTGSVNDSLVSIIVPIYNAEKYLDSCIPVSYTHLTLPTIA